MEQTTDILILGGGMVGLSLAYQICNRFPDLSITIVDKERRLGEHSSGRNSGVLHAGVYYPPKTLKAKVCVAGAQRLAHWCDENNVPILKCGKVISPQHQELDSQLDILYERATANGAYVELIDKNRFEQIVPYGKTASGRALWSPNTAVVKPKKVLERLQTTLEKSNVNFLYSNSIVSANVDQSSLVISDQCKYQTNIQYGHLFNTTGLQADKVAHLFGVGLNFKILPFKGLYWELSPHSPFNFTTNLYPVPDLNVPFLGVHVTPSIDGTVTLGPTAIPALGRENYYGLTNIEPALALDFLSILAGQWIRNDGGFRRYSRDQAFHGIKNLFVKSAKLLIPELKAEHLLPSKKVGIRSQLYDTTTRSLVQDFVLEHRANTSHVLNAISPAFTASFALADHIIDTTPSFAN